MENPKLLAIDNIQSRQLNSQISSLGKKFEGLTIEIVENIIISILKCKILFPLCSDFAEHRWIINRSRGIKTTYNSKKHIKNLCRFKKKIITNYACML